MQPSPSCAEKETLTQRCELAKALHIQAAERVGGHPTSGFDQAYKEAGVAKSAHDAAMDALAAHVKEHGC